MHPTRTVLLTALGLLVAATGCGAGADAARVEALAPTPAAPAPSGAGLPTVAVAQMTASTTTDQTVGMPASALNLAALPLGTGKSATAPEAGRLYRCGGLPPAAGPPVTTPPWVNTTAKTWDMRTKDAVEGAVTWKSEFTAERDGTDLVLKGNGLPPRSGTFPVAASDPAHAYNPDPLPVISHTVSARLPWTPRVATTPSCEDGVVGLAANGIPLLDGFDAGGYDAVALETQDTCHGHPNPDGYHYHSLSPCMLSASSRQRTTQVGWALDGFGIFAEYDSRGRLLTNADLDGCHGRTSKVPWQGGEASVYHYVVTFEFPYTVGCFRGTPTTIHSGLKPTAPPGP